VANFLTTPIRLPWDGAILKATSLLVSSPRRGGYIGDPITSGYWVDSGQWGAGWRDNGGFDYARAVGDPSLNAIVWACLVALCKAFPEAPLKLYKPDAAGELEAQPNTQPAVRLLRRPNPRHTWEDLAPLLIVGQHATGDAYLWKARSAAGRVIELWPLPSGQVWPVPGASTTNYIDHYAYKASEREAPLRLETSEVIHLTLMLDPDRPWRGRNPLMPVLKHIFTDEEATAFLNAMLKNYGVPGALLTPDPAAGEDNMTMSEEQALRIKAKFMASTGGARRGEPVVIPAPIKVALMSFNPDQMQLDTLQELPETRICAALGVPPIIAGMAVGLKSSTYSNAKQFAEGFTTFKLAPYWRQMAAQLTLQLLPDFYGPDSDLEYGFDLSDVRALQEDEDTRYQRLSAAVTSGWVMPNEARREIGLPDLPGGDVLYIPSSVKPTEPDNLIPEPPPPPVASVLAGDGADVMGRPVVPNQREQPGQGQGRENGRQNGAAVTNGRAR
jgi:HK97 family phage portal protein